jgi:uncharacterized protein
MDEIEKDCNTEKTEIPKNIAIIEMIEKERYPGIRGSFLLAGTTFLLSGAIMFMFFLTVGILNAFFADIGAFEIIEIIKKYAMNLKISTPIMLTTTYTIVIFYMLKIRNKISFKDFISEGKTIKDSRILIIIIFFLVLCIFLSLTSSYIFHILNINKFKENMELAKMVKGISGIILGLGIAPFFEEIIFRGIILRGIAKKHGNTEGVIISAMLFSIFHFNMIQLVPTFIFGLFAGYIYIKTNSLKMTILCHFTYNLLPVLMVQIIGDIEKIENRGNVEITAEPIIFFGILLLILGSLAVKNGFEEKRKNSY